MSETHNSRAPSFTKGQTCLYALNNVSTGKGNVAFGYYAGYNVTTGNRNTAIGYNSMTNNNTGEHNVALGLDSLKANTTGSDNLSLGSGAGKTPTTASGNISIGKDSGPTGNYNNNICIGNSATAAANNVIQIGNNSSSLTLNVGNAAIATGTGITTVGTVATGTWQGTAVANAYVANDLTISGGTVENTVIGNSTPAAGTFSTMTAQSTLISKRVISTNILEHHTLSTAQLLGGFFHMDNNASSTKNITLPTASDIVGAMNNPAVGSSFIFYLQNSNGGSPSGGTDILLVTNTGNTIVGGPSVQRRQTRAFLIIVDNVGSPAVTVRCIGKYEWT